jgi:hypothetical protein
MFEDSKGVIGSSESKEGRQCNCQKKEDKKLTMVDKAQHRKLMTSQHKPY